MAGGKTKLSPDGSRILSQTGRTKITKDDSELATCCPVCNCADEPVVCDDVVDEDHMPTMPCNISLSFNGIIGCSCFAMDNTDDTVRTLRYMPNGWPAGFCGLALHATDCWSVFTVSSTLRLDTFVNSKQTECDCFQNGVDTRCTDHPPHIGDLNGRVEFFDDGGTRKVYVYLVGTVYAFVAVVEDDGRIFCHREARGSVLLFEGSVAIPNDWTDNAGLILAPLDVPGFHDSADCREDTTLTRDPGTSHKIVGYGGTVTIDNVCHIDDGLADVDGYEKQCPHPPDCCHIPTPFNCCFDNNSDISVRFTYTGPGGLCPSIPETTLSAWFKRATGPDSFLCMDRRNHEDADVSCTGETISMGGTTYYLHYNVGYIAVCGGWFFSLGLYKIDAGDCVDAHIVPFLTCPLSTGLGGDCSGVTVTGLACITTGCGVGGTGTLDVEITASNNRCCTCPDDTCNETSDGEAVSYSGGETPCGPSQDDDCEVV